MPIYEYRCTSCGNVFEKIQKFSDPPLASCESCNGKVEKLISRTAFHLKGGGWFSSGYTSNGSSAPSGSPGSTPSSSPSEAPSKPDGGEKKKGDGKGSGGGCGSACACH